jgi:hypothetical protein
MRTCAFCFLCNYLRKRKQRFFLVRKRREQGTIIPVLYPG